MIKVPTEIDGLPVIASVSGGKDSTALILALREAEVPARFVFADTGWEAPETYAYLDTLRSTLGITIDVVGVPGGMVEKIRARAGFPARMQRWCTRELKIEPLRAYHDAVGDDTVSALGIRAAESEARAKMAELEDEPEGARSWGGWIWRPLLRWSVEDVLAIHHRHGVPVNPLYRRGHDRVGCYPCIYARKEEVRLVAEHSPDRIDLIRSLEREVTDARAARNAEEPGRYAHAVGTFFQSRRPDRSGFTTIDEVVAWSKTKRGGRELPLLPEPPTGGCMRWGLCDMPTEAPAPSSEEVPRSRSPGARRERARRRPGDRHVPVPTRSDRRAGRGDIAVTRPDDIDYITGDLENAVSDARTLAHAAVYEARAGRYGDAAASAKRAAGVASRAAGLAHDLAAVCASLAARVERERDARRSER